MSHAKDFNQHAHRCFGKRRKTDGLPEIPIIIPLVVAGSFLGSAWTSKDLLAIWKKAVLASTVSGLLNAGYALVLGILKLPIGNSSGNNSVSSIALCGLGGFVIVLAVYLSAMVMMRYRRGRTIESEE
jgi:hypothetical protein